MAKYYILFAYCICCFQMSSFAKNYLSFISQNISSENIRVVEILNKEQYLVNTNERGIQEIQQRHCDFTICDIITNDKSYFFVYPEKVSRPEIEKYCKVLHSFSEYYLVSVESNERFTMLASKPVKLHMISLDNPEKISTKPYTPINPNY